jgi:hypothetical protein
MWLSLPRSKMVRVPSTYPVSVWAKSDRPSFIQMVSFGSV